MAMRAPIATEKKAISPFLFHVKAIRTQVVEGVSTYGMLLTYLYLMRVFQRDSSALNKILESKKKKFFFLFACYRGAQYMASSMRRGSASKRTHAPAQSPLM